MRVVSAVLIILGLIIAVVLLLPLVPFVFALAFVAGGFVIWLLPILIIAVSDRTTGPEKLAWILAIVFLSWFAWIFYFLLAPIRTPPERRYLASGYGDRYDYRR